MEKEDKQNVSESSDTLQNNIQNGAPLVFLRESSFFAERKPYYTEFFKHEEMFHGISRSVDPSHITGLQRVNGLWRIYIDNLQDKATLITEGVSIRGRALPILQTNPFRSDNEDTTRIRVQNIPKSVDDGMITRDFVLKGLDVISCTREKLRINGKLTNCDTGDRLVMVQTISLKEPLGRFINIGKFKAKVIHRNQNKSNNRPQKCLKCLETGHVIATCENEWRCTQCKLSGHKKADCPIVTIEAAESSASSLPLDAQDDGDKQAHIAPRGSDNETRDSTESRLPPRSKAPKPRKSTTKPDEKRQNSATGVPKGQVSMDKFMKHGDLTPSKQRSSSVPRSPPTPAEILHDTAKKSRQQDESDTD